MTLNGGTMAEIDLQHRTLEGLTGKLEDLPVLPLVVARLMALSPSSEDYFDDVLSLVESDPPFAARVIQAANSSKSAPLEPIRDLRQALARMGARLIGELVTAVAVTRVFVPRTDSQRALWSHALDVALIARELAHRLGVENARLDAVYLGGLLHDLGRFVMFDGSPEELGAIEEHGWSSPNELIEAERELCGYDHAELGWLACRHWGFPDEVATIVRDHHLDEFPAEEGDDADHAMVLACIQAADVVAVRLRLRPELREADPREAADPPAGSDASLPQALSRLTVDGFPALVAALERSDELAAELGLSSPTPAPS